MAERSAKKQKKASKSPAGPEGPRITDARFANIQSDPRYRLPGRRNRVKLDKRFSRVLQDEEFTKRAKVDRYGRPLESNAEKNRLKRKYEFDEDEDEEASDAADDDDEIQTELNRLDKAHDPLREGRDTASSSDETSSDEDEFEEDDVAEETGPGATPQTDVPTGEVTSRIAIVNLDWDNIRAADLMAVFHSFLPPSGSLLKVAIYPSEFGKERLEREEMEGPPKEIFADVDREDEDEDFAEEDEDDDEIKKSIVKPDDGAEFDSAALRRYQLERLRYFYCILTFSSPVVAKHIYDAVDGTEYLRTANFFDLRFVPDDTDFSTDTPREECDRIPDDYKPNEFVTDALQHSKVKLTWDAEDTTRKEAVARAFGGSRQEIDENDLKAYLGSDSSEDEDEADEAVGEAAPLSKKEAERQRMRALLGLGAEPEKKSKKDKGPVGDMQITFTSGLTGTSGDKKRSVFENSPELEETTVERYVRKERERKQKRKEKRSATREGRAEGSDAEEEDGRVTTAAEGGADAGEEDGGADLGFEDPFFAAEPSATAAKAASKKMRKEERLKKRQEREQEEEAERKQRAQLELLMVDDHAGTAGQDGAKKIQHFDMREIQKAEKLARRKDKKRGNKDKDKAKARAKAEGLLPESDAAAEFKVDTADPRFARLFESHEYAIDPTNPRFQGTRGMRELLEEGRRRKGHKGRRTDGVDLHDEKAVFPAHKGHAEKIGPAGGDGDGDNTRSLVDKIKKRSQSAKGT